MAFAVSQLNDMNIMLVKSDVEFRLQQITNELLILAKDGQQIVEQQSRAAQEYIDSEDDETMATIEYVNSDAFNLKYTAQLKAIQVKEQTLDVEKQQLETKQKALATEQDGFEKRTSKNIESLGWYKG